MKQIIFLIVLCGIVLLQSCAVPQVIVKGTVTALNVPKPEIVIKQELRDFLKKNPNPRIVLRVPSTTTNVTSAESERNADYNSLYGRIEKELMKAGFTVRDRSLLNNLLSSGQNLSYKEIGEKTETDIIIEIISIRTNKISDDSKKIVTEYPLEGWKRTVSEIEKDLKNVFSVENSVIDCKIILVNDGTTAGMFTFNYCRCDKNLEGSCSVEFLTYKNGKKYRWINDYSYKDVKTMRATGMSEWYNKVNFITTLDYTSEVLSRDLIRILSGQN
jgi:hypothetical protein